MILMKKFNSFKSHFIDKHIEEWGQLFVFEKSNILTMLAAIFLCELTGFAGKFAINTDNLMWYDFLFKPALTPPHWMFSLVWTVLYFLMGCSLFFVVKKETERDKPFAYSMFGLFLFLNIVWPYVFFGLHSMAFGFILTLLICVNLYVIFYKFYKISVPSAFLLLPSILWVSYAVGLNFTFWILNP